MEMQQVSIRIREHLHAGRGASSLLLTAFGAGAELIGAITLLRSDPRQEWSGAEIEAVEFLAEDVGRGLEHARLYEGKGRLVAELQALDQAKTSFIAAASHDVRTPLTSILGNLELIMEGEAGPVGPEQGRMLEAVRRNARRRRSSRPPRKRPNWASASTAPTAA